MYFRMHNWEEWLHVQKMSQFWAGLANFDQVWPVFAHDVGTKESCIFCAELFLQIQRVSIDLSSEHIECPQKNAMPTDSDFNSLLIQLTAGLAGKLCRSTNTFASHLHEIQDKKEKTAFGIEKTGMIHSCKHDFVKSLDTILHTHIQKKAYVLASNLIGKYSKLTCCTFLRIYWTKEETSSSLQRNNPSK